MRTPNETIDMYIEATRSGDVEGLKNLFLPEALMSGFFEGEFYSGSAEVFFDEVRDNPSPSDTGKDYLGEITYTEVIGNIAQVTMKERGYLGLDFSNMFHLACVKGQWLILSKTYIDA